MKTALVFGGQGSQHTGVGQKVYNHSQKARSVFELASSIVGYDVAKMCFEASQEELNKTVYCQICTLAVELALYEVFKGRDIQIDAVAGFSLGEYAALVASNVISLETAFRLVSARAQAMEEAVKDGIGKMVAVINLDFELVETICESTGKDNAMIANYNSYKQVVVSLTVDIYDCFVDKVKSLGGHIVILKTNRPFHHTLMRPAAERYHDELQKYNFVSPDCPLYINVTGEKFIENDSFVTRLYEQIFMPVRWINTIENMLADGIKIFYEFSPKPTVGPFINNISGGKANIFDIQNEI